jgi:hypothetical protein
LQVDLPLRAFFDAPTIVDLADVIAHYKLGSDTDPHKIRQIVGELEALSEEETQQILNTKLRQEST